MTLPSQWQADLQASVKVALEEDIQDLDITAELIPAEQYLSARIISRDAAVICARLHQIMLRWDELSSLKGSKEVLWVNFSRLKRSLALVSSLPTM